METDLEEYMSVFSGRRESEFERYVTCRRRHLSGTWLRLNSIAKFGSYLKMARRARSLEVAPQEFLRKKNPQFGLFQEGKAGTFEFQAHPLFDLIGWILCNLAVLVAVQVQVLKVGVRTHRVSSEVEEGRKNEEEEEEREREREREGIKGEGKEKTSTKNKEESAKFKFGQISKFSAESRRKYFPFFFWKGSEGRFLS